MYPVLAGSRGPDDPDDRIRKLQDCLLEVMQARFGPPTQDFVKQMRAIQELERLDELFKRALLIDRWQELLPSDLCD